MLLYEELREEFEGAIFFRDDGYLTRWYSVSDIWCDIFCDICEFIELRLECETSHLSSLTTYTLELFFLTRKYRRDIRLTFIHDSTRWVYNFSFWAIVLLQDDELRISIEFMKDADITSVCSLEFIDRLIIISHGEYIRRLDTLAHYACDETQLSIIGILILVYHDPLILLCHTRAHDIILLDETYRTEYHIGEIDEWSTFESISIPSIECRECTRVFHFTVFFQLPSVFRDFEPVTLPCGDRPGIILIGDSIEGIWESS